MSNEYANAMAFMATVAFLMEVKGYSKEEAIVKAREDIKEKIK